MNDTIQPFGWLKSSEVKALEGFGGSLNLWRKRYSDCDIPLFAGNPGVIANIESEELKTLFLEAFEFGRAFGATLDEMASTGMEARSIVADALVKKALKGK